MNGALGPLAVAVLVASAVLVAPGRHLRDGSAECHADDRSDPRPAIGPLSGDGQGRGSALTTDHVVESLVLLALAFRSGLPTWDVLEAVSARSAPVPARDLRQVATALRWGASGDEAWAAVDSQWASAARAIALAARAGIAPGPLLLRAADDVGKAEVERLEVSAAKVTVRLVLPLGLVLLPAFVLTTVLPIVAALARQVLSAA